MIIKRNDAYTLRNIHGKSFLVLVKRNKCKAWVFEMNKIALGIWSIADNIDTDVIIDELGRKMSCLFSDEEVAIIRQFVTNLINIGLFERVAN